MSTGVTWEGDPIFYRRPEGYGLVIRDLHYRFDATGRIEAVGKINALVLKKLLERVKPEVDTALLMLAASSTSGRQKARMETRKRTKGRGKP